MSKSSSKGYQFTIKNGLVTQVFEIKNGRVKEKGIDFDESWSVQGSDIVKIEFEHGIVDTTIYADADGDGIYAKTSAVQSGSHLESLSRHNESHSGNDSDESWTGTGFDDHYNGAGGSDHLRSGAGNDELFGGDGDDYLYAAVGNDTVDAGAGDDLIVGGTGKDQLVGGAGSDTFKFTACLDAGTSAANRDVIVDFSAGDKIDVSAIDAAVGTRTNDAFKFIGTMAALSTANANGALWFHDGILYGSNDKDVAAEFQIELTGAHDLSAADFLL